jgi:hypothetical protein
VESGVSDESLSRLGRTNYAKRNRTNDSISIFLDSEGCQYFGCGGSY